jgi:multisubunit Na+/H+ antiporter MnhE subunit
MRRVLGFLVWIPLFAREFLLAQFAVVRTLLFTSNARLEPGFVAYDVASLRPFEILVLSHLITLTPGTTSADLVDEGRTLLVHALDAGSPEAVRESIRRGLERPLLRWTR